MFFLKKPVKTIVRPRSEHPISRKNISPEALNVLYGLHNAGYKAYLVGGGVRDLLLGRKPTDFDVSTDARPQEIKRLFRRCFLVGKRFRLAHVVFGNKVIETSTFRKQPAENSDNNGSIYQTEDNTFGTAEEDALRRDFTVNGLFYDIATFDIIDYVGGLRDLDRRILRSIGDPNVRFREDPVRMLRAVRLSARLGLTVERSALQAIKRHYAAINESATPRVLEEILKLFDGAAAKSFQLLWETRLMSVLLPQLSGSIDENGGRQHSLWSFLASLDKLEKNNGEPLSNGLRVATLYYVVYQDLIGSQDQNQMRRDKIKELATQTLSELKSRFMLPKAIYFHAINIIASQPRLSQPPSLRQRIRPGRAHEMADAIRLASIIVGKDIQSDPALKQWWDLLPAKSPTGKPAQPRRRPRRSRPGSQNRQDPSDQSSSTQRRDRKKETKK